MKKNQWLPFYLWKRFKPCGKPKWLQLFWSTHQWYYSKSTFSFKLCDLYPLIAQKSVSRVFYHCIPRSSDTTVTALFSNFSLMYGGSNISGLATMGMVAVPSANGEPWYQRECMYTRTPYCNVHVRTPHVEIWMTKFKILQ